MISVSRPVEGTANSMKQNAQFFCQIDVHELHLGDCTPFSSIYTASIPYPAEA